LSAAVTQLADYAFDFITGVKTAGKKVVPSLFQGVESAAGRFVSPLPESQLYQQLVADGRLNILSLFLSHRGPSGKESRLKSQQTHAELLRIGETFEGMDVLTLITWTPLSLCGYLHEEKLSSLFG